MALSLKHLRLVRAVVQEGTLTEAAKRLYLTQSALSHQLADLEREAGAPVFVRVGRRMLPTEIANRIFQTAEATLAGMDALADDLKQVVEGRVGTIRITTQCHTSYHWLPKLFREFKRAHPGIDLRVVPTPNSKPTEAVLCGEVDVAIAFDFENHPALAATHLLDDELILIVPPGHELAGRPFVTAHDFEKLDLMVYQRIPQESFFFKTVLIPHGIHPHRVHEVRLTEAIVQMVEADMGAAIVAHWSVAPEIKVGRIVPVRVTETGLRRSWSAVTLKDASESVHIEDFIHLLKRGGTALIGNKARLPEMKVRRGGR
jgi:LysR family transcriptional regulator, regulator for metE and metH